MTYTAIFANKNSELTRTITFHSSHNRSDAWKHAESLSFEDTLVCIVPGINEVWSPDLSI